jgi:hypothetical protein
VLIALTDIGRVPLYALQAVFNGYIKLVQFKTQLEFEESELLYEKYLPKKRELTTRQRKSIRFAMNSPSIYPMFRCVENFFRIFSSSSNEVLSLKPGEEKHGVYRSIDDFRENMEI